LLARKRYEMIGRGHTAGAEAQASPRQAFLIWVFVLGLIVVALLPHLAVIAQSFSERWFFSVTPERWTAGNYGEIFQNNLAGLSRISTDQRHARRSLRQSGRVPLPHAAQNHLAAGHGKLDCRNNPHLFLRNAGSERRSDSGDEGAILPHHQDDLSIDGPHRSE